MSASGRFASPELLQLGPPPALAARSDEDLLSEAKVTLVELMAAGGITFDVSELVPNPGMILTRAAVYRDTLRRREVDEAVSQTVLGSASGAMLDQRAADYGVLRRTLSHTLSAPAPQNRPSDVPEDWEWSGTVWREPDSSLRTQARLAWEALSVAGPRGAYAYHAGAAHPQVLAEGTAVYGPESGLVEPGEVVVVVQSRRESGVPEVGTVDSVAARLDAHEVIYSSGATRFRTVRDEQSVRPLGARVIVKSCQPITFYVAAKLYVRPGPDPEVIRQTAEARLRAYLATRKRIGLEVPVSAISAALHVADANGLPIVEEVEVSAPTDDIAPDHDQLALVSVTSITIEVR